MVYKGCDGTTFKEKLEKKDLLLEQKSIKSIYFSHPGTRG